MFVTMMSILVLCGQRAGVEHLYQNNKTLLYLSNSQGCHIMLHPASVLHRLVDIDHIKNNTHYLLLNKTLHTIRDNTVPEK